MLVALFVVLTVGIGTAMWAFVESLQDNSKKLRQLSWKKSLTTVQRPEELNFYSGIVDKAITRSEQNPAAEQAWMDGEQMLREQSYAKAASAYQRAIDLYKSGTGKTMSDQNRIDLAERYERLASCYFSLNQLDAALAACNSAIEARPNAPRHYFNRSAVYRRLGKLDLANADLKRSQQLASGVQVQSQILEPMSPMRDLGQLNH